MKKQFFKKIILNVVSASFMFVSLPVQSDETNFTAYDLFSQLEGDWNGRLIGYVRPFASGNYDMRFEKVADKHELIMKLKESSKTSYETTGKIILFPEKPNELIMESSGAEHKKVFPVKKEEKKLSVTFKINYFGAGDTETVEWIFVLDDSLQVNYWEASLYMNGKLAQKVEFGKLPK